MEYEMVAKKNKGNHSTLLQVNEFTNERAWQIFVTCSIVSNETKKLGGSVVLSAFKKTVKVVQVFEGDNFFLLCS